MQTIYKMKRFLNKAKEVFSDDHAQDHSHGHAHTFGGNGQQPIGDLPDRPSNIQPPTPADVDRYRYHHGTNIGSVFAIERWLTGSRFPDGAEGSSEKAAAETLALPIFPELKAAQQEHVVSKVAEFFDSLA